jgi:hypothetical protein
MIQQQKIALHVAGGAGLDLTNMVRARLEARAPDKNCEAELSF